MSQSVNTTKITDQRVACPSGLLQAKVITPDRQSGLPPLVVLHGISRNADDLVTFFAPEAATSGRIIVVPHFEATRWPHFQRPCRAARPDQALLALLLQLAAQDSRCAGPVDLFGHSGGAQLAHRFAMLYPQWIGRLHLAAAGWYCLPDATMAYPYGLEADAASGDLAWVRRHRQALAEYLRLPVQVYVGSEDNQRDDSLRQTPLLDLLQGPTRTSRARTYVDHFAAAARRHGIAPDITLTTLDAVDHDVAVAIRTGGLARIVTRAPSDPAFTCAS